MKKRIRGIVISVAAALCLWGCKGEEAEKYVLNLSLDAEISTLDAQAAVDSASLEVIGATMEGLYRIDGEGNAAPAAAEREEISEDGLTRRYYLKETYWSDGSRVTADDFVYGFRRAADPSLANENAFLLEIAGIAESGPVSRGEVPLESLGVRAAGEDVLEITLDRPVPYFQSMMAFPLFFPARQEFVEECGQDYATSPDTLLANGPYQIASYEPSALSFTLEKNPFYGEETGNVEEIRYQVVKDSQQSVLAFQDGILDIAPLSGEQAQLWDGGREYHSYFLASLWYISPNQKVKGLENVNLRKALAMSFDKEAITGYIMRDGSAPADFAVPRGAGKGPQGQDFRDDGKTWLEYDKLAAASYWEQARKELGLKDGEILTYTLLCEDTETASLIAQFIQGEIQENLPGIAIEIERVPKKVRLSRMKEGDYDLGLVRWGADYEDPTAFLSMWTTDSPYNYGSWSDEEYDKRIGYAVSGFRRGEEEKRWEQMKEAEEIVMEQAAIFPICQKANAYLISEEVTGMEFHPVGINRIFRNVSKKNVDRKNFSW